MTLELKTLVNEKTEISLERKHHRKKLFELKDKNLEIIQVKRRETRYFLYVWEMANSIKKVT